MSLSQQTLRRLPTIKAKLLQNWTIGQIADILGVTERTIDRDLKAFLDSGQFEQWLKEEWVHLHAKIVAENPIEAYRQVSKLISRNITRKAEIKAEFKGESIERKVIELDPEDRALLESAARGYIKASHKTKSASIH